MHVRCPHCQNPIEVVGDADFASVPCPSCGSSFSIVSPAETVSLRQQAGKTLAHFELIKQMGMGSFGSVWKARDCKLDRIVAIKVPRPGQLDEHEAEKFLRDARAAAQVRHPHIAVVHEVGREDGTLYIVSDFIDGLTLADWLTGQRPSFREAATLVATAAEALHHAHEAGVVHRDLKPSNLILDSSGAPHIIDFGLAKRDAGEITMTQDGTVLGTPAYMSPEQARGEGHRADRRSDVYSLGVILFELLTGERPFRGNTRMLIHQVLHEEPPGPRKLNAAIPRDLETICLKCMEKDPGRRYPTAKDLAEELQRYLKHEPIRARPITRLERAWRWARREPRVAGLLAAVAASLLIGTVTSAIFAARAQRHANDAVKAQGDLQIALGEEIKAKDALAASLYENTRQLSLSYLDRGVNELAAGQKRDGLLKLLRAYQLADAKAPERASALNLMAGWGEGLKRPLWSGDSVQALAFSPDGETIVVGSRDGIARLWDAKTLLPRGAPLRHARSVHDADFSPDGKLVATASFDGTVKLWNVETCQLHGAPLVHDDYVTSVAFSPDGTLLLTGSNADKALLWNLESRETVGQPLVHADDVEAVAFSPDGQQVVTGSEDKTARIWSTQTQEPVGEPMQHEGVVTSVAYSHDGRIVTGSFGGIRVWDGNGRAVSPIRRNGTVARVVAWDPQGGNYLAALSNSVFVYDAESGKTRYRVFAHGDRLQSMAVKPDGQSVLFGGFDGGVYLSKVMDDGPPQFHSLGTKLLGDAIFSPDGTRLLTTSELGLQLRDAETYAPIGKPLPQELPVRIAFSPDGKTVVAAGLDKYVRLYDIESQTAVGDPLEHPVRVGDILFSPDGTMLLTVCADGFIYKWQVRTGSLLGKVTGGLGRAEVQRIAISPDGQMLAACGAGHTVRLFELPFGTPRGAIIHHDDLIRDIAFSPDGRLLLTGSNDYTARLWDANTGAPVADPLRGNSHISSVDFSSCGRMILTGGEDRNTQLWDSHSLKRLRPGIVLGNYAVFHPTGSRFLIFDRTGHVLTLKTPPRLVDEPERIQLWIEVSTARRWGENNVIQELDLKEWVARRNRLDELGGPPIPWE